MKKKTSKPSLAKYIHILWGHDTKFSGKLLGMINSVENGFNIADHLFVTPCKAVYEELKEYGNVLLDTSKCNLFNKYAASCDYIVSHSFNTISDLLFIKRRYTSKIIFRWWGGSFRTKFDKKHPLISIFRKLTYVLYRKRVSSFAAIGIANAVDEIDIRKCMKTVPLYRMPYKAPGAHEAIEAARAGMKRGEVLNVLVGHRGTRDNNHIEILRMLQKYDADQFRIFVPLSYGKQDWIAKVKDFIRDSGMPNVTVIEEMMPYAEYANFLAGMDVAIFDGKKSYALGNISLLLYFNKKLFVHRESLIREAFQRESAPHYCIDEIGAMEYEEFSAPLLYAPGAGASLMPHDLEWCVNQWKELFAHFR